MVEIFQVSGVPFVAPFDVMVGHVKAKDAPISKGLLLGVDMMGFCPFDEVEDHPPCEGLCFLGMPSLFW